MHESKMHQANSFITLTYDDEHLPPDGGLKHADFVRFMKKLREHLSRKKNATLSYYMCGEYGDRLGRPHYHAALFGVDFTDKYYWRTSATGHHCYRSPTLESLWTDGLSEIGELTYASAIYIARYVQKKITGEKAKAHYTKTLADGTRVTVAPEYNRMSLRPAIGKAWYDKWKKDVYNNGQATVIHDGRKQKPPRYYDSLFAKENPEAFEALRASRKEALKTPAFKAEQTLQRRTARAAVHQAYTARKPRN